MARARPALAPDEASPAASPAAALVRLLSAVAQGTLAPSRLADQLRASVPEKVADLPELVADAFWASWLALEGREDAEEARGRLGEAVETLLEASRPARGAYEAISFPTSDDAPKGKDAGESDRQGGGEGREEGGGEDASESRAAGASASEPSPTRPATPPPLLTRRALLAVVEPDMLEAWGSTPSGAAWRRREVRAHTRLVYAQRKFNLLREASEGYSKVLVLLSQAGPGRVSAASAREARRELRELEGFFDLDPNRVAALVLEAWASKPGETAFQELLAGVRGDSIAQLLGWRFEQALEVGEAGATDASPASPAAPALLPASPAALDRSDVLEEDPTPFGLYAVASHLLRSGRISIEQLMAHLAPSIEEFRRTCEEDAAKASTAVDMIGVVVLGGGGGATDVKVDPKPAEGGVAEDVVARFRAEREREREREREKAVEGEEPKGDKDGVRDLREHRDLRAEPRDLRASLSSPSVAAASAGVPSASSASPAPPAPAPSSPWDFARAATERGRRRNQRLGLLAAQLVLGHWPEARATLAWLRRAGAPDPCAFPQVARALAGVVEADLVRAFGAARLGLANAPTAALSDLVGSPPTAAFDDPPHLELFPPRAHACLGLLGSRLAVHPRAMTATLRALTLLAARDPPTLRPTPAQERQGEAWGQAPSPDSSPAGGPSLVASTSDSSSSAVAGLRRAQVLSLLATAGLPAAWLSGSVAAAAEAWSALSALHYALRWRLYGRVALEESSDLARRASARLATTEARKSLRRATAPASARAARGADARALGRRLARSAAMAPVAVADLLVRQVSGMPGMAASVAGALADAPPQLLDCLTFAALRALARPDGKVKADGANLEERFTWTAGFVGALVRAQGEALDLRPLAQYAANALRAGEAHDAIVLREVILALTGLEGVIDASDAQLDALSGSDALRELVLGGANDRDGPRPGSRAARDGAKRLLAALQEGEGGEGERQGDGSGPTLTSDATKDASSEPPPDDRLARPLLILLGQQRRLAGLAAGARHVKLAAEARDDAHEALWQYVRFLQRAQRPDDYAKLTPAADELALEYGLEAEVAMEVVRPLLRRYEPPMDPEESTDAPKGDEEGEIAVEDAEAGVNGKVAAEGTRPQGADGGPGVEVCESQGAGEDKGDASQGIGEVKVDASQGGGEIKGDASQGGGEVKGDASQGGGEVKGAEERGAGEGVRGADGQGQGKDAGADARVSIQVKAEGEAGRGTAPSPPMPAEPDAFGWRAPLPSPLPAVPAWSDLERALASLLASPSAGPCRALTPLFYAVFWQLRLGDLVVPESRYEAATKSLQSQLRVARNRLDALRREASRGPAPPGSETEVYELTRQIERDAQLLSQLPSDLSRQRATARRVNERLQRTKSRWVLPADRITTLNTTVPSEFVSSCLLPRSLVSPEDAVYCARFLAAAHRLRVPRLSLVNALSGVLPSFGRLVVCSTPREATCLGIFLCEVLELAAAWKDPETYARECATSPGFCTKRGDAMRPLARKEFVVLVANWHRSLADSVFKPALASGEYVSVRNALMALARCVRAFPATRADAKSLCAAAAAIRDEDDREDLRTLARMYVTTVEAKVRERGDGLPFGYEELAETPRAKRAPKTDAAPASSPGGKRSAPGSGRESRTQYASSIARGGDAKPLSEDGTPAGNEEAASDVGASRKAGARASSGNRSPANRRASAARGGLEAAASLPSSSPRASSRGRSDAGRPAGGEEGQRKGPARSDQARSGRATDEPREDRSGNQRRRGVDGGQQGADPVAMESDKPGARRDARADVRRPQQAAGAGDGASAGDGGRLGSKLRADAPEFASARTKASGNGEDRSRPLASPRRTEGQGSLSRASTLSRSSQPDLRKDLRRSESPASGRPARDDGGLESAEREAKRRRREGPEDSSKQSRDPARWSNADRSGGRGSSRPESEPSGSSHRTRGYDATRKDSERRPDERQPSGGGVASTLQRHASSPSTTSRSERNLQRTAEVRDDPQTRDRHAHAEDASTRARASDGVARPARDGRVDEGSRSWPPQSREDGSRDVDARSDSRKREREDVHRDSRPHRAREEGQPDSLPDRLMGRLGDGNRRGRDTRDSRDRDRRRHR